MRHLELLAQRNFFGDVTIKFQAGRVTLIEERRVLKLEELPA